MKTPSWRKSTVSPEDLESLQALEDLQEAEAPGTKLSSRPERTGISCHATIREGSECTFPQCPTETLVLIDTFVQWIRRRASANLALNSHSL
jgi:hypothetical protein